MLQKSSRSGLVFDSLCGRLTKGQFVCSLVQGSPVPQSIGIIEIALEERRSLEGALADLAAKYERYKTPALARMIKEIEAEITLRRGKSN